MGIINFNKFTFTGCFNWERLYCTSGQTLVAVYSEIKDLPKHPEKLLIDVREPREIDEYGKIPGSINIPRKLPESSYKTEFYLLVLHNPKPW